MTLAHWPMGSRDTTEFPEVNISEEFRSHLKKFLELEGKNWNIEADSRFRTYRKMYQNLGLVYQKDSKIYLSPLGHRLVRMKKELENFKESFQNDFAAMAVETLAKYQLDNPTESQRDDLPGDCDVFPCICIWKAMLRLDEKLHYEEIDRKIAWVMKMDALDEAIDAIREFRKNNSASAISFWDWSSLGQSSVTDSQTSARIAPWFSLAGWGGLIIERNPDNDGFRNLTDRGKSLIAQYVKNNPQKQDFNSEDNWYKYYTENSVDDLSGILENFFRDVKESGFEVEKSQLVRFLASFLAKRFVVLTGLSGSGKTKLAQAFARWITQPTSDLMNFAGYAVVPVGADWTSNENVLGYPDALDKGRYVRTPALDLVLRANKNPICPFFLIFDEMNLSHVERYFADFLSAIESGEKITLHGDTDERDGVPHQIEIPRNLFVVGTVNVDDTTYLFSPKVLDRANTLEFRLDAGSLSAFLKAPHGIDLSIIEGKGEKYGKAFVKASVEDTIKTMGNGDLDAFKQFVEEVFGILAKRGFEFGYRSTYEMNRFVHFHKLLSGDDWIMADALDAAIYQKILPRIHGSSRRIGKLLEEMKSFCKGSKNGSETNPPRFSLSLAKIDRMLERLEDGFTSFSEA